MSRCLMCGSTLPTNQLCTNPRCQPPHQIVCPCPELTRVVSEREAQRTRVLVCQFGYEPSGARCLVCSTLKCAGRELVDLRRKLDEATKALSVAERCHDDSVRALTYHHKREQEAETRLASAVGALKDAIRVADGLDRLVSKACPDADEWRADGGLSDQLMSVHTASRAALATQPVEGKQTDAEDAMHECGALRSYILNAIGFLACSRVKHGEETEDVSRADELLRRAMDLTAAAQDRFEKILASQPDPTLPPGVVPGPTGATTGATPAAVADEVESCDECGHPPARGNVVYKDSGTRKLQPLVLPDGDRFGYSRRIRELKEQGR
jgi:hypothetical protein